MIEAVLIGAVIFLVGVLVGAGLVECGIRIMKDL